jgi:hypothetical protein
VYRERGRSMMVRKEERRKRGLRCCVVCRNKAARMPRNFPRRAKPSWVDDSFAEARRCTDESVDLS